jgi:hypothetical protein
MCNCNQKRAAIASESEHSPRSIVKVKLVENTPLSVTGNYTGRTYKFRSTSDVIWVDKRDVPSVRDLKALQIFD